MLASKSAQVLKCAPTQARPLVPRQQRTRVVRRAEEGQQQNDRAQGFVGGFQFLTASKLHCIKLCRDLHSPPCRQHQLSLVIAVLPVGFSIPSKIAREDNSGKSNIFPTINKPFVSSPVSEAVASQGLGGAQGGAIVVGVGKGPGVCMDEMRREMHNTPHCIGDLDAQQAGKAMGVVVQ
eukprot:66346-Pelagomonas_calceolata.AAC.3